MYNTPEIEAEVAAKAAWQVAVQDARAYWIRNIEYLRINWGTPLDTENAKNKLQILLDAAAPTPAQSRVGRQVECRVCGRAKAPRGRSVSPDRTASYCNGDPGTECEGYYQDPQPDTLFPGEQEDE